MKRELLKIRRGDCTCCPGHDKYPNDVYRNNRSKRARARDIKKEHKLVRILQARELYNELNREICDGTYI